MSSVLIVPYEGLPFNKHLLEDDAYQASFRRFLEEEQECKLQFHLKSLEIEGPTFVKVLQGLMHLGYLCGMRDAGY